MYKLLSYLINEDTPMYGGKKGFFLKTQSSIKNGDSANTSFWQFPNHLGTHIDFPNHFYEEGQTVEDYSAEFWMYNGEDIQLLEVTLPNDELLIKPEHLNSQISNNNAKLILLKTDSGRFRDEERYWKFNPGISIELAEWLREHFKKLQIIGLDSISVSSWQYRDIGQKVHRILLHPEKPILLIEDMDLSKVNKKTQFKRIIIVPLMVSRANGCPCTIFTEVD
jgi:arylformamidase